MIKRGLDVKLNVKPIFLAIVHQYYYEGPCRFAKGEALNGDYERLFAQQKKTEFFNAVRENMPPEVNVLEPVFIECHDDWVVPQEAFDTMIGGAEETDVYLLSGGIARSAMLIELAQRTGKPIIQEPETLCDITAVSAAVKSRGLEYYAHLTWEDIAAQMKALRARKALRQANILLGVRFDSNSGKSGNDTFISLEKVTETFGTHFRFLNLHELLDYMTPISAQGNHTTPGRMNTPNITEEDIKKAEQLADEILAGADDVHCEREYMINSCKAYVEVRKLLDIHDCCGFTVPCPDACSTRRLNELKFTFCLTHSLLNEEGIPSACEYDIDAVLSMLILSTISGNAPYMGNVNPLVQLNDGSIRPMPHFHIEDLDGVEDRSNLFHCSHSVANRKFKGINGETSNYGVRHFAYDQGFGGVFRYNFKQDAGQKITMCRISPDCTKLMLAECTIVGGGDYDVDNCNGYMIFRVEDQKQFFKAQCLCGNHVPLVYGSYAYEIELLGECLGLEVIRV